MQRIALLTGGESSERDISLRSAESVRVWLQQRYEVEVFDFPTEINRFLDERETFIAAVPVFHGRGGEDGTVQGFLKTLNIPFIFSDVEANAIGMDKVATKALITAAGIRTASSRVLKAGEMIAYDRPSVVKVPDAGSSVGVFLATDELSFQSALESCVAVSDILLVEDFIQGREFTVPIVEHAGKIQVLPVIEIRSKNAFFDLESKYNPSLADEICPAPISRDLAIRLESLALRAHNTIGARHMSRTDFIVDANETPWFLEINTIPGMTQNSLLPKSVRVAGLSMEGLLDEWIASVL